MGKEEKEFTRRPMDAASAIVGDKVAARKERWDMAVWVERQGARCGRWNPRTTTAWVGGWIPERNGAERVGTARGEGGGMAETGATRGGLW